MGVTDVLDTHAFVWLLGSNVVLVTTDAAFETLPAIRTAW